MRPPIRMLIVGMILMSACLGCSGSKEVVKPIPPSVISLHPAADYTNRFAVLLTHTPSTAVGRQMGERYFEMLINAIRDEGDRLQVVTPKDQGFPEFLLRLAQSPGTPDDVPIIAEKIRLAGYNGWGTARIGAIHVVDRQSGFFLFRKEHHYVFFDLQLAVYDPITGAKIIDDVIESSAEINEDEYPAFKAGQGGDYEDLIDTIDNTAEDMGEKAADTLDGQAWRISIVKVENGRIFLPAGALDGLRAGDRLTVFQGRRSLSGLDGAQYFVPGFEIGRIEIVSVTDHAAEARDLSESEGGKIQAGDFAASVK